MVFNFFKFAFRQVFKNEPRIGKMEEFELNDREEKFAKSVRAGKRTYFFDVKETRNNFYYITITESKKRFNPKTGQFFYEKHKIFLYPEDFDKFAAGLMETIDFVKGEQGDITLEHSHYRNEEGFENLDFDDLDEDEPNFNRINP